MRLVIACAIAVIAVSSTAQADAQAATPPLDESRITGEVVIGGLASAGLALLAADRLDRCTQGDVGGGDSSCQATIGVLTTTVGTLAASAAVTTIGRIGNETGSFEAAFGGAAIGCVPVIAAFVLVPDNTGLVIVAGLAPGIGAAIGFNLTRRYRTARVIPTTNGVALAGTF